MASQNKCEVYDNCRKKYACWYCHDYNEYSPIDKRILSGKQIRKREERKDLKKAKRNSAAVKRGKANRRNGKRAEREIELLLQKMGLDAVRVPMSGALKAVNLLPVLQDRMAGDITVTVGDKELRVECKRNVSATRWFTLAEKGLYIEGFCYLFSETLFRDLLYGNVHVGDFPVTPDKRFKQVHKYFNQDDSDIVVVTKPYAKPIFFVKKCAVDVLNGSIKAQSKNRKDVDESVGIGK